MHSGSVFHSRHVRNGPNFVALLLNFRTLTIFVFLFLFIILFYYYNESQDSLELIETDKEKCQQSLDSVSAQLQVVYEHKSRLEKSLQHEKETNLKVNREKDSQLKNDKIKAENQKQEVEKRYNLLQERLTDVQTQYQDIKNQYDNLKQQLNELKDEKQANQEKAEENLKIAQNKIVDVQRQNDDLVKEIGNLRDKNAQLQISLNEKELQPPKEEANANAVQRSSRSSSLNLDAGIASATSTQLQQINGPISSLQDLSKMNDSVVGHIKNNGSQTSDHNVIIENILPPFHQVPITDNNQIIKNIGAVIVDNDVNTIFGQQTRQPLNEVKQIHKPFDDGHQKMLLENAKFPMAPDDRQQGDQQPVLQHPLGEDQQNLLNLKPAKSLLNNNSKSNDFNNEIENIGHLPVNVRHDLDDTNDALQVENADDDDGDNGGLKRKKIPMPNNNNEIDDVDDRDKAAEAKFKRDDVQAGARVLNEPKHAAKEYPGGIGGGGGEKDEENDDTYRDDEEEKKYKDAEV